MNLNSIKRETLLTSFFILLVSYKSCWSQEVTWKKQPLFGDHKITFGAEWSRDGSKYIRYLSSGFQLVRVVDGKPLSPRISTVGDGIYEFVNDDLVFSADYKGVRLWKSTSGAAVGELIPHYVDESTFIVPVVTANGKRMVVRNKLDEIQIWDLEKLSPVSKPFSQMHDVDGLAPSADGKYVFSFTSAESMSVWEPKQGRLVAGPFPGNYRSVHLPEQKVLLTPATRSLVERFRIEDLVIRSCDQGWREISRVKLRGMILSINHLDNEKVLIAVKLPDYTCQLITMNLRKPQNFHVFARPERANPNVIVFPKANRVVTTNHFGVTCWEIGKGDFLWTCKLNIGVNGAIARFSDNIVLARETLRGPLYSLNLRDGTKSKVCEKFSSFDDIRGNHLRVGNEIWTVSRTE